MFKTNFNKSSGIENSEDDTTNTWNHHYQVSQDQQAMKVANQSQSVEKFKANQQRNSKQSAQTFKVSWQKKIQKRKVLQNPN